MTGKLGPDALAAALAATGAADPTVTQGPAYGEDAAAIDLAGAGETLVVAADPLSLAAASVGTLAVHVACNDVAASGADPRWLTHTLFLPDDDLDRLGAVVEQVDATASDLGCAVVGGHTEVLDALSRPLCSMTAMGTTDRFVSSGGAEPGDRLLLTKGAAIEATAILASDFREACREAGVPAATLDSAADFLDEVSVVPDAAAVRDAATALHDPTEGGVATALVEMASASGGAFAVERDAVPVRPETRACCDALGVDPLAAFGSGALLAAVPPERVDDALDALDAAGIEGAAIGVVESPADESAAGTVRIDGEPLAEPPRDELYPLWEAREAET
ncbi:MULTISPECIES: AIR synthase family protein [Halorubrum]|uniref:Hydrogenase expression/formation protein HypE n=1 Tax=Halorubrum sodomense TaxID=35743 RepID=A0A1I6FKN0_HALSD|nr:MULTISPECIES: AIR synthase family protein [Halorubrum]TKX53134.1 hydrogenase expression protein [Halorubrum sp. SP3]TKX67583.1 hydrogenase expression protein [Halorubrum sp. SP9]SFR30515.1 hydrogenase expression/formation protein HypE [Halorubrum sodomense]